MDHEVDPISIEDILVLRGMSDRLVDPLRCTKALVDATLAENPSSECD